MDVAGPDWVMTRRPLLSALMRDTSTVTLPLGPGTKDVTFPVITKSLGHKLDCSVPVLLQAWLHSGFIGRGFLLTAGFLVTVLVRPCPDLAVALGLVPDLGVGLAPGF